jgi:hypothetical protein
MLLPTTHLLSFVNRTLKLHHHCSIQSNSLGGTFLKTHGFPCDDYSLCIVVLEATMCPNFSLCELLAYVEDVVKHVCTDALKQACM